MGINPAGAFNRAAFYSALESNGIQPFESVTQAQAFTAGTMRAIAYDGRIFHRDFADTTTANDGINTIVTLDGKRFKSTARLQINTVETSGLNAPPSLTASDFGKAWRIGPAPTGAWVANANNLAVWTALGWFYVVPTPGNIIFVNDTGGFSHFSNGSGWLLGFGPLSASASSVAPAALLWPAGITVAEVARNAPPALIANAYIIGPVPTGAWGGKTNQIAVAVAGQWSYLVPYEGAEVWDGPNRRALRFTGGIWTAQNARGVIQEREVLLNSLFCAAGTVATPPTTATGTLAALFSGVVCRVGSSLRFRADWSPADNAGGVVFPPAAVSVHASGAVSATAFRLLVGHGLTIPITSEAATDYRVFIHGGGAALTLQSPAITMREVAP